MEFLLHTVLSFLLQSLHLSSLHHIILVLLFLLILIIAFVLEILYELLFRLPFILVGRLVNDVFALAEYLGILHGL